MERLLARDHGARILAGCLGALLVLATLAPGSLADGGLGLRLDSLDTSEFPSVTVRLGVMGDDGLPIPDLPAGEFLLSEDGRVVTPSSVTYGQGAGPLSLVLAVDTSGSMAGQGLQAAQAAARALVEGLPDTTQVAVVVISTTATVATDFTGDRDRLGTILDGLKAGGDTAFFDGVFDAAGLSAKLPPGRKLIVALTDGEDTSSAVALTDAADRAEKAQTRVYTVGFGASVDPATLKRLAKLTGGLYYAAPTAAELVEAFRAIAEAYSYEYEIRFQSGLPLGSQGHVLQVRVEHQGLSGEASQSFVGLPAKAAVQFASPPVGPRARGPVPVEVHALGLAEVVSLELQLDGQTLTTAQGATLSYTWDSSKATPGAHTLKAIAQDATGALSEGTLDVEVAAPVEVGFAGLSDGQEVAGDVLLRADVETGYQVGSVEFSLDGQPIKALTAPPFELNWDASQVPAGPHELKVLARTAEGHSAEKTIAVTVLVPVKVQIVNLPRRVGSPVRLTCQVTSTAGIVKVEYYLDDKLLGSALQAPYRYTLDPRALNLSPGEHVLVVRAQDLAGYSGSARATIAVVMGPGAALPWLGLGIGLVVLVVAGSLVLRAQRTRQLQALTTQAASVQKAAPAGVAEKGTAAPAAVLEVASGPGQGLAYPLLAGTTRLGRAASRNDIKIEGLTASREHAIIKLVGSSYVIEDITDKNPTIVNGREIHAPQELVSGDRIEVGDMVFIFRQGGR